MKKILIIIFGVVIFFSSCNNYIHNQIKKGTFRDDIAKQDEENRSKEWPKELVSIIKPNTLHEKLQKEFMQFSINTCNCVDPKRLIIGKKYDYIPKDLVRLFGDSYFDIPIETANDISNFSLFFYPFSGEQRIKPFDSIKFNPRNIISVEGLNYTLPYKSDARFSSFFYSNTCSQYLFGSFDGKLSMPVFAIEAGLKAESQQQSTLIGVGGYFSSPLDTILSNNSLNKYSTFFYLWDFYSDDSTRNNKDFYYLNSIKAISFKTAIKSEQMELLKLNGNLNIKAGFAEISSRLSNEINQTSFFSGQAWKTFIDKEYINDNRLSRFNRLPKSTEIKKFIENFTEHSYRVLPTEPLYQNTDNIHYVIFKGIPPKYRKSEEWHFIPFDSAFYNGVVTVEVVKSHFPFDECMFMIIGKPNDELFSVDRSDYKLFSYVIRSVKLVGNKSLDLKVSDIGFEINKQPNLPNIIVSQDFPSFAVNVDGNKYDYVWKFQQSIIDEKSLFSGIPNKTIDKLEIIDEKNKEYLFNNNLFGKVEYNPTNKFLSYEIASKFETTKEKTKVIKIIKTNVVLSIYIGNNPKKVVKRMFQLSLPVYEFITKDVL